ncbi:hypothetical protein ABWK22_01695 [Gottfriedia acidiceleris]|uniref:hypothetical protein n=1 Tax=Gottfriedia acidiceleris TaxID=371036 RepID=UPI003397BDDD
MYRMWRSYATKPTDLPTDDLLEAVKMSLNYEADFYIGSRLLISWMGMEMDYIKPILEKEGIEIYVVENKYCFRYIDPAKNIKKIYISNLFNFDDGKGEVHLSAYRTRIDQPFYSSLEEVYEFVKSKNKLLVELNVVDFSGDKYEGSFKIDLLNDFSRI